MGDWLAEVWVVLCHSRRTQLAITLGVFCFAGILIMGQLLVRGLELHGPLAAVSDVVRDHLMHQYDKAAWAALGGFAILAIKTYRRDRRRFLGA